MKRQELLKDMKMPKKPMAEQEVELDLEMLPGEEPEEEMMKDEMPEEEAETEMPEINMLDEVSDEELLMEIEKRGLELNKKPAKK